MDCALAVFFLLCDVPSTEFSCDFNRFSFPVMAGTTALQSAGGRSNKVGLQTGNKRAEFTPPDLKRVNLSAIYWGYKCTPLHPQFRQHYLLSHCWESRLVIDFFGLEPQEIVAVFLLHILRAIVREVSSFTSCLLYDYTLLDYFICFSLALLCLWVLVDDWLWMTAGSIGRVYITSVRLENNGTKIHHKCHLFYQLEFFHAFNS